MIKYRQKQKSKHLYRGYLKSNGDQVSMILLLWMYKEIVECHPLTYWSNSVQNVTGNKHIFVWPTKLIHISLNIDI